MFFGKQAEFEGLAISGIGRCLAAPDVPWELVEQQHESQGCLWVSIPVLPVSVDRLPHRSAKPAVDLVVHARPPSEPLDRSAFQKPECQDLLGLDGGAAGQARSGGGEPAPQLNAAFVHQSPESLSHRFLRAVELILMTRHPGHLPFGDHAGDHDFQEQFSEAHQPVADACRFDMTLRGCSICSPFFMPGASNPKPAFWNRQFR